MASMMDHERTMSRLNHEDRDYFALRPQKRGGLLGTGTGGGRGRKSEGLTADTARNRPERTVDRRQNNGSVKAVSPRHCPATSALRNYCFSCRAWAESQKSSFRNPAPPPYS